MGSPIDDEASGLWTLNVGAILALLGSILATVGLLSLYFAVQGSVWLAGLGVTSGSTWPGWLLVAGALVLAIAFYCFGRGLSLLASVDGRFGTASSLAYLGVLGGVIAAAGGAVLTAEVGSLLACFDSPTAFSEGTSCVSGGPLLPGVGLLVLAGIFGFLAVLGLLLGTTRLHTRYESPLTLAAGISIFVGSFVPGLSAAGFLVLLLGLSGCLPTGEWLDPAPRDSTTSYEASQPPRTFGTTNPPSKEATGPTPGKV